MARIITRAELARQKGVSRAAVTKACAGKLAPACEGDRVNLDHPAVRAYLGDKWPAPSARRDSKPPPADPAPTKAPRKAKSSDAPPTKAPKGRRKAAAKPTDRRPSAPPEVRFEHEPESTEDLKSLGEYLQPLTDRFGTSTRFKDWLDALKKIEDILEKRLKNAETEGELIPREPIQTHIFGAIDAANKRLLRDTPRTLVSRVYAMAAAGNPKEEAERVVHDLISSQLRTVKVTASRVLRAKK